MGQKTQVIRLNVSEDDYGNRDFSILSQDIITGIISIPANEVMLFTAQRDNNDSRGNGGSIYDVLPIEAFFQFSDKVEHGDILIYKYLLDPDTTPITYHIMAFQVVNMIGKMTNSLLWIKYVLAPYTLDIGQYPEIKTILDTYLVSTEEGVIQE
ncbi:MAG: hypothetical protein WCJ62_09560 [Flavobacterium sp.]